MIVMAEKSKTVTEARRVILRIDSREALENFINKIIESYSGSPGSEFETTLQELVSDVEAVKSLVGKFLEPQLTISNIINPPRLIDKVFKQKLLALVTPAETMFNSVAQKAVETIRKALETKDPNEVDKAVREYFNVLKHLTYICSSFYISSQVLFSIVSVNMPAKVRPPLSNILIGYDIVE